MFHLLFYVIEDRGFTPTDRFISNGFIQTTESLLFFCRYSLYMI